MTGYEEFVSKVDIQPGKVARLWEVEVHGHIENLLTFCREFLKQRGFNYTGYSKEHGAIFNNRFMWDGAVQDGNKIAIRLKQI